MLWKLWYDRQQRNFFPSCKYHWNSLKLIVVFLGDLIVVFLGDLLTIQFCLNLPNSAK